LPQKTGIEGPKTILASDRGVKGNRGPFIYPKRMRKGQKRESRRGGGVKKGQRELRKGGDLRYTVKRERGL